MIITGRIFGYIQNARAKANRVTKAPFDYHDLEPSSRCEVVGTRHNAVSHLFRGHGVGARATIPETLNSNMVMPDLVPPACSRADSTT